MFGWNAAQRNCSARGGNLVAIHSQDENAFVLSWASRSTANVMWIGLKVKTNGLAVEVEFLFFSHDIISNMNRPT